MGAWNGKPLTSGYQIEHHLNRPEEILFLPSGELLVADTHNHVLRSVSHQGEITTFAGTFGAPSQADNYLTRPRLLTLAADGTLYVKDDLERLLRISPEGAFSSVPEFIEKPLMRPTSILALPSGTVFLGTHGSLGTLFPTELFAGKTPIPHGPDGSFASIKLGTSNGVGTDAEFNGITGMAYDPQKNSSTSPIAETTPSAK